MNRTNKSPPEKKGYAAFIVIRKIIVYLFCICIIIAAFLFAANQTPNKSLFGYRYYTVITPSMTPTYRVGDLVFVKIESADNIQVGDVITFNPSSESDAYLTHRVTEKLPDYQNTGVTCFRTKGDANDSEDSFLVDEDRVIGTVKFKIPKLGYIIRFVQLRWYFILPLAVMLWISLRLMRIYFSDQHEEETDPAPSETKAQPHTDSEKGELNYEKQQEE